MKIPRLRRAGAPPGPHCVICHRAIDDGPQVRIRGMHFHRRCATYKTRLERSQR